MGDLAIRPARPLVWEYLRADGFRLLGQWSLDIVVDQASSGPFRHS